MRDHPTVEVAPGWLAVQTEKDRRRAWALIEIRQRQSGKAGKIVSTVRLPGEARQVNETIDRSSQYLVHFLMFVAVEEIGS
jgi:hypothetical protein